MVGDIELRGLLPPSTRLATGAPFTLGREAEIGQLVVEEHAVDGQARAERAFDRRGVGGDVAGGVDRDEVRGAGLAATGAGGAALGARRRAGARHGRSRGRARSAASARRDRRGRSARRPARGRNRRRRDRPRGRHKRAACDSAIRCQAAGLSGPERAQVEPLELLQDREHRGRARRGRPHPADPVAAIACRRPARARLRLVGGEVVRGHRRGVARRRRAPSATSACACGAGVEMLGAARGEPLEQGGELGVARPSCRPASAGRRPRRTARGPRATSAGRRPAATASGAGAA